MYNSVNIMAKSIKLLSFVIPAKNEEESVEPLYKEILKNIPRNVEDYEIIFIDDGSNDDTFKKLASLNKQNSRVKIIKHRGNFGKSAALQAGFEHTKGEIIITMDADLQDNPSEIPNFLDQIENGYDMVSGWKKTRHDPLEKVIPSRIFNFIVSLLTGIKIHDTNCGFKAYKRSVVQNLNLYGEQYRFIPIFAAKQNFRVGEIVVEHRKRKHGKTKFGMERHMKGFLDLITVVFLTGYLRRPGHFFGGLGLITFFFGFLIGLYISYLRFTTGTIQDRHPLLFFGMLLMIIGVQLVTTGLLAELLVHFHTKPNTNTNIEKVVS